MRDLDDIDIYPRHNLVHGVEAARHPERRSLRHGENQGFLNFRLVQVCPTLGERISGTEVVWMLGTQLKVARTKTGYLQKQLDTLVGADGSSVSVRMNQYGHERHSPDMRASEQLVMVLQVPMAYLYCLEDELAELIPRVSSLAPEFKKELARFTEQLFAARGSTSRRPVRTRGEL